MKFRLPVRFALAFLVFFVTTAGQVRATNPLQVVPPPGYLDDFGPVRAGVGWAIGEGRLMWRLQTGVWRDLDMPNELTPATAVFFDDQNGTLMGFIGAPTLSGLRIADTSDGAASWSTRSLSVTVDPAWLSAPIRSIRLSFVNNQLGWLVITRPSSPVFSLGLLLITHDGGQSWQARNLPASGVITLDGTGTGHLDGGLDGAQHFVTSDFGQTWSETAELGLNADPLVHTAPGAGTLSWQLEPAGCGFSGSCAQRLVERDLGGEVVEILRLSRPPDMAPAPANGGLAREAGVVTGGRAMFDSCHPPALAALQAWWDHSPYTAVNLYDGPLWACRESINSGYTARAATIGWAFVPTWVGPQSNCWMQTIAQKISPDPAIAFSQGRDQANAAGDWLQSLGLDANGAVVYYDIESYTQGGSCRSSTSALIAGWSQRLHERGLKAGVYGAPCSSFLTDFVNGANTPDAIWIAAWYSSYYFRKGVPLTGMPCLNDTLWTGHQRLRQYTGGHNETWGGVTLNIDSSIVDAPVATVGCQAPRPTADQIMLFGQAGFCGVPAVMGVGSFASAAAMGFANDSAVSIRIGGNLKAMLCRDNNWQGVCESFLTDTFNLAGNAIGANQLSSIQVALRSPPSDPPRCSDGYEPDNTAAQANPLPVGNLQTHTICDAGDVDWVYLDLIAGKPILLRATATDASSDPLLRIFAPDGSTQVAQNDDAVGVNAQIFFTPAQTGRYYARVEDATGKSSPTRSYTLQQTPNAHRYVFPLVTR